MNHPDQELKCLLIHPRFPPHSFWNYAESCKTIGAKTHSPPLGLITVAAILPPQWKFRLVDLNTAELDPEDWEWADLICTGGMLPQQNEILRIIQKAKRDGKDIVVGGPDPTGQPEIYKEAEAIVCGEGEASIPVWIDSWRKGQFRGIFKAEEKPNLHDSPIPRYDLLRFNDYLCIGVQYSRGCPLHCEFCNIADLYGSTFRTKEPKQLLCELDRIYDLGYRGWIDLVDDNFVGIKSNIKQMLPELISWGEERKSPFFFSTEVTLTTADDQDLLRLMQRSGFRTVFIGVETTDSEILRFIGKAHNTTKPITQRVNNFYRYGISVAGGFVIGFDNEKPGMDQAIIQCIEEGEIVMAMVGLLTALPNTRLTQRLREEGRLLSFQQKAIHHDSSTYLANLQDINLEIVDLSTTGLNFITTRDRLEIINEYANIVRTVYSPKSYMNRVLHSVKKLRIRRKHLPNWWEIKRLLRGLFNLSYKMTKNPTVRLLYWRNFIYSLFLGPKRFEMALTLMGGYLHFQQYTDVLLGQLEKQSRLLHSSSKETSSATSAQAVRKDKSCESSSY